jgi:NADPH:quinone reductase-like Zn-dependent oxidoreductase
VEVLELPGPRELRPDEVLIDVQACGVGNWDEFARTGGWDLGVRPPMALGVEAAGLVAAVGDRVTGIAAGDRVTVHSAPLRDQGRLGRTAHRRRRTGGRPADGSARRRRCGAAGPCAHR